jgi:hypothetical protein
LPPNAEIIDSTGSGLEKNWVIIVLAQDEGYALIAEEFEAGRYRGFFTTNRMYVLLSIKEVDI